MIFPLLGSPQRPDRYSYKGDKNKNSDYDRDMGRYYIGCANNPAFLQNLMTFTINASMYANDQWIFKEDLELFFMEEGGDTNNRIKQRLNIFRNILKSYTNNTLRNIFQFRAFNISESNMDRMKNELAIRMSAHQVASAMPDFWDYFKSQYNLGDSPEETEMNFYDETSEKTDNAVNALFKRAERMYQLTQWKGQIARSKVLGGFACVKDWYRGGEQTFELIDTPYAIYDINAKKPDLSDGQYAGDIRFDTYTSICEQYPNLSEPDKHTLDEFSRKPSASLINTMMLNFGNYPTDRIPVITITWKDIEVRRYGFIQAQGMTRLIDLDSLESGKEVRFMDASELTPEQVKMMGSDGVVKIEREVPRYCEIICKEMIRGGDDIVLSHGEVPYSISKKDAPFISTLPYHFDTYDWFYGRMLTPLDTALDCQRIINRLSSTMEAQLNNAMGTGLIIADELQPSGGGKSNSIMADLKMGRTVKVKSARTGFNIQNNVIPYSGLNAVEAGIRYMEVIQNIKAMGEQITSVNSDMTGFNKNPRQLVGVQENNIEQGFMLQGDFIDGIAYLYYKIYWSIANRGRRIACDNETKLIDTVGASMAQMFQFTRNMASDAIHVDFRRVPVEYTNQDMLEAKLLTYLQYGLIGPKQFARLVGKSEMDDIYDAVSEWQQQQVAATKDMAASQQMQQNQIEQKQAAMIQLEQADKRMAERNQQMIQEQKNRGNIIKTLITAHNKVQVANIQAKEAAKKNQLQAAKRKTA